MRVFPLERLMGRQSSIDLSMRGCCRNSAHRWHTMTKSTAFVLRAQSPMLAPLKQATLEDNPIKECYFGIR